ncbi:MAG TPA: hypothetical protein PK089_06930 [Methanoregulaceae archaeon]|nr:hypothetical protein [Methanoregulaceae archaeon]HQJ88894.1 hypothetical protein [Methanoregulaceae archaeon]
MTDPPYLAGPVLNWCTENGVVPVPCRAGSKAPIGAISSRGVYGGAPPSPEALLARYGRERFGTVVRDSFHLPTPERLERIARFWRTPGARLWGPGVISISVDMNYPTADGYTVACLDIDDDTCLPLLDSPPFEGCPVVVGRHGAKALFKLDREGGRTRPITQFAAGTQGSPAFELFTCSKHALVFGLHPASTPECPVRYRLVPGRRGRMPVLRWSSVAAALLAEARGRGLVVRKGSGPDLDQAGLERWV